MIEKVELCGSSGHAGEGRGDRTSDTWQKRRSRRRD